MWCWLPRKETMLRAVVSGDAGDTAIVGVAVAAEAGREREWMGEAAADVG